MAFPRRVRPYHFASTDTHAEACASWMLVSSKEAAFFIGEEHSTTSEGRVNSLSEFLRGDPRSPASGGRGLLRFWITSGARKPPSRKLQDLDLAYAPPRRLWYPPSFCSTGRFALRGRPVLESRSDCPWGEVGTAASRAMRLVAAVGFEPTTFWL